MARVVAVDVILTEHPATEPPFRWRTGLPGSEPGHTGGWLVIRTDVGVCGLAYAGRGVILRDLVERRVRGELLGADPLDREWLWHRMWELDRIEEFPIYIQGVVDTALWDIGGKLAELPVYRLIGSYRSSIPAYASTVTFGSVEEYLDVADQALAAGYSAIKLHAWGDPRRDVQLCTALRTHVGPEVDLMYDGSAGFDLLDAIYVGRALGELDYRYLEEPMREFSINAYRLLAERVDVPLLVAETSDGAHMNTADFIASKAAVAVRTSAGLRGGITGALRIAHLADAFLMRAEVHGGGLVGRHLCMSIPNTTYYESMIVKNPLERERCVDASGLAHAPTGAGIGFETEWNQFGVPENLTDLAAISYPIRDDATPIR